jgi:hypothetical protein
MKPLRIALILLVIALPNRVAAQSGPISCGPRYTSATISFRGEQTGCTEISSPCTEGEAIDFTAVPLWNVSTQCPAFFIWDFGDNGRSSGLTTTHRYTSPSYYRVYLLGSDGRGGWFAGVMFTTSLLIDVAPPRDAANPDCSANSIQVMPSSLPPAIIGRAYTQILSASGGKEPYSFSIADGSLPPGLLIRDGTIAGRPLASGIYAFIVKTEDSQNCPAFFRFTITTESSRRRSTRQ